MSALEQEELWVMLLDTRNRLLKIDHLYKGSLNSSMVRVGEVFKAAIRRNAASLLVMHNHPSGDPTPSPDDINLNSCDCIGRKIARYRCARSPGYRWRKTRVIKRARSRF